MAMPVNVKEIISAAADTDAARGMSVNVCVFFDPTAPDDLFKCMHDAFQARSANASVRMDMYPESAYVLGPGTDLAVLVAGQGGLTGELARSIRDSGVPAVTVTTSPQAVKAKAAAAGRALEDLDVVAPAAEVDGGKLPADSDFNSEPYPLTVDRMENLLDRLGEWIVDTFREKRLAFALAFPFVRRPLAIDSVNATAAQNAGIGLVIIIPGADMPVMTLNQAKMLLQIAAAYDKTLGKERLLELAAVVGGGFACRAVSRQLVALAPGWGWAIKAGVGYSGTIAMGYAAIAYFERLEGDGTSVEVAMAAARTEAARVQEALRGASDPASAAFAVARTLAADAVSGAASLLVNGVPTAVGAVRGACADVRFDPAELGRRLKGALGVLAR